MTVYFISGLGADERAFQRLTLPQNWKVIHIHWDLVIPGETIVNYAKRLSSKIDSSSPFALVGLSFGGIIAIEISKIVKPDKLCIISSISTNEELPSRYKLIGKMALHKLVPVFLFMRPTTLTYWFFGMSKQSEKALLKNIIESTPYDFLIWAIDRILKWQNKVKPEGLFHIHGDQDRILPISFVKPNVIIRNAGHFMVYTHAEQVSKYLKAFINGNTTT